jgi:shikimate dehydrogenase
MKQYGIIGFPLTHSFSQDHFTRKFETLGLTDHRYDTFPIRSIEELPGIIHDNPSLIGLNITIPYKKAVLDLLDDRSGIPPGLAACNCIKIGSGKLSGFNTDITGFQRSLEPLLDKVLKRALILGTGGAAAAVRFVLEKMGIEYRLVSRTKNEQATLIYTELDPAVINSHHIIINTTPLGTFPDLNSFPAIPYHLLTADHLLFDLVYNPVKTEFLKKGEAQGAAIKNGHEMLLIQAEESWAIWNRS